MKSHFLITEIKVVDRHTESGGYGRLGREELTITLNFVGSGNTTKILNAHIVTEIMERLKKIGKK